MCSGPQFTVSTACPTERAVTTDESNPKEARLARRYRVLLAFLSIAIGPDADKSVQKKCGSHLDGNIGGVQQQRANVVTWWQEAFLTHLGSSGHDQVTRHW